MVKFEFSSLFFLLTLFYFKLEKNIVKNMLTLSGGGGDCCNPPPPFGFSLVPFLLRLPFGQFPHPLKTFFKNKFAVKKVGGRGGCSKSKIKFPNFHFLIFFPFVITMIVFQKYLRYKVDFGKVLLIF